MKQPVLFLLFLAAFADAKPSYPIHPGVGAIYKGPNSETIIEGPDGSVITSEAGGGVVAIDGHNSLVEAAAAASAASAHSITAHQIIDQSAIAAATASHRVALSQAPIVVEEAIAPIAVAQPVVVAHQPLLVGKAVDTAALEGPSGSIVRHGENAIISGPSSTTIREGNIIASVPKPELNTIIVEPARTLVAPQGAAVVASVGISHGPTVAAELANVAEINAHLADVNLINQANLAAAQISEANQAAVAYSRQEAIAKANLEAQARANLEAQAQANIEAQARANLEAQAIANIQAQANLEAQARANAEAQANLEAQARANLEVQANLEAQLAHAVVAPQIRLTNVDAVNAAALARSQEALAAKANQDAVNSAVLAHSQEAIARANLEAQLAVERNAIVVGKVAGLNPLITQGNQIISDAITLSTPAPVIEVTPVVSTQFVPGTSGIVSSTLAPLVSSTIKQIGAAPIITHPTAIVAPVAALDGGQVVYQSSSSSSSQAQSHSSSSSQSSSVNVVGGAVAGIVPASVSDYAQWQESFSKSAHSGGGSVFSTNVHGGRLIR